MSTDDELRDIFHENVKPVEPPPGVADQIAARVSQTIATAGGGGFSVSLPIIIAIGALSGLLIGGLLGFNRSGTDSAPASALTAAPIYACPGDGQVGTLHRGDRVMMIGQSGDWIAVRNVRGSLERVFVHSDHVTPDETANLPEANCDEHGTLVVAGEEITTTTTTIPDTTTTTAGPSTTTTVGDTSTTSTPQPTTTTTAGPTTTTPAPTTTVPTTTTTTAPDTTAPTIANAFGSPGHIWEQDSQSISCTPIPPNPPYPRQATISATVTDNRGVASVTALWNGPSGPQATPMTKSGDTYSGTFGPFAAESWTAAQTNPYTVNVTITIDARDAAGNKVTDTVSVIVHGIASCFG